MQWEGHEEMDDGEEMEGAWGVGLGERKEAGWGSGSDEAVRMKADFWV